MATSAGDMEFLDCFPSLGLTQAVHTPTFVPSYRILDLVFSSDPLITALVDVLPPIPGCGHYPVVATGFFKSDLPIPPPSRILYDWFRTLDQFLKQLTTLTGFFNFPLVP